MDKQSHCSCSYLNAHMAPAVPVSATHVKCMNMITNTVKIRKINYKACGICGTRLNYLKCKCNHLHYLKIVLKPITWHVSAISLYVLVDIPSHGQPDPVNTRQFAGSLNERHGD